MIKHFMTTHERELGSFLEAIEPKQLIDIKFTSTCFIQEGYQSMIEYAYLIIYKEKEDVKELKITPKKTRDDIKSYD